MRDHTGKYLRGLASKKTTCKPVPSPSSLPSRQGCKTSTDFYCVVVSYHDILLHGQGCETSTDFYCVVILVSIACPNMVASYRCWNHGLQGDQLQERAWQQAPQMKDPVQKSESMCVCLSKILHFRNCTSNCSNSSRVLEHELYQTLPPQKTN